MINQKQSLIDPETSIEGVDADLWDTDVSAILQMVIESHCQIGALVTA